MTRRHITSKEFYDAFILEWNVYKTGTLIDGASPWKDRSAWTKEMQEPGGFLNRVMDRLSSDEHPLYYKTEWYKVDALYVGGEDLHGKNHSYPAAVEAIIEHEFGEDLENEMWKLIHWRSPLKVIISFDWSEVEKTTDARKSYAQRKIAKLLDMLKNVNQCFPENQETEYLFLMYGRKEVKGEVIWWAESNNSFKVAGPGENSVVL